METPSLDDLDFKGTDKDVMLFFKELTLQRISLLNMKNTMMDKLATSKEIILSRTASSSMIAEATNNVIKIVTTIGQIDERVQFIDMTIITAMETHLGNVSFEMVLPEKYNNVGDMIEQTKAVFSTDEKVLSRYKSRLNPNSLWTYQTLKKMFDPASIEIIKNEDAKN